VGLLDFPIILTSSADITLVENGASSVEI